MKKFLRIICWFFTILFTLSFLAWGITRIAKTIEFDTNCSEYIYRAANASTSEIAKDELAKAIKYAEENNLTSGSTKIVFDYPSYDVGFWYKNMKQAYAKLDSLPEDVTELEESNIIMQIHESLTYSDGTVRCPSGITVFPYNTAYCWWGWLSLILGFAMWIFMAFAESECLFY